MKYLLEQKVGVDPLDRDKEPRLILHRNMEMQRSTTALAGCWCQRPFKKLERKHTHSLCRPWQPRGYFGASSEA